MAHMGPPFTSLVGAGSSSGGGGGAPSEHDEVVLVVTGNESRPNGDVVLWVGGSTEPANYGPNDVWFPSA